MHYELEVRKLFNKKTPLTNSLTYVLNYDKLFRYNKNAKDSLVLNKYELS